MQTVFKTLLEKITPSVITEEQASEMLKTFDDQMDQLKLDAQNDGETSGFDRGYEEGKKIAQAEAQANFDAMLDKYDIEATEMLTEICKMLDDNYAEKLQTVYEVLKQKEEELLASKEKALIDQDEDYAEKMDEIVEAIDAKHTHMLLEAKEVLEDTHAKMLNECVSKLKAKHKQQVQVINEKVENYLAYALQQHIPDAQIIQEEKFNVAQQTLAKISDLLSFNNIIQESANGSQVFDDYVAEIENQKAEINRLISENINLKSDVDDKEVQIVLEQKLHNLTPATQDYVRSQVVGITNTAVICEKIEDAVQAYRKQQAERRKELVNEVKVNKPSTIVSEDKITKTPNKQSKVINESVDVGKKPVVEATRTQSNPTMDYYVKTLTKKLR